LKRCSPPRESEEGRRLAVMALSVMASDSDAIQTKAIPKDYRVR
jgi:hypothetical protein